MEKSRKERRISPSSRSSKSHFLRNVSFCAAPSVTIILFFYLFTAQSDVTMDSRKDLSDEELFAFWKNLDLSKYELPIIDIKSVDVAVDKITIKDVSVTYRSALPPTGVETSSQILFLLHGAAFTSKTWVDQVPTMQTMASLGYKIFAVDLPGFGETPSYSGDRGEFLDDVIKSLCGDVKPVLVSPSMSGSFSLPLIERDQESISGFIPVAPVGTGSYSNAFYQSVRVPTMIVYGEADYGLGRESKKNLELIPTSTQPQELAKARHPAYLDQPDKWHQLIYNFMKALA